MSNKKLNDPTLPIDLEPLTWEKPELIEETIANKKVSFVLGADAKVGVSVFNAESDTDPSEVFGKAPDALIPFSTSNAWLKYAATCNIKVKGGLDIKSVGFEMDLAAGLEAYVYRKHGATELLKEAQASDLQSVKTIFSKAHIKELAIDEAVGLEFAGKLGASISVLWSDVWSSQLSVLADLLDTNELIKLKVGPEASIKASIQIADTFRTQVVKKSAQKYQLLIKRNQSKKWTAGIALEVGIEIENPEVITNRLDALFEEVFEVNFTRLKELVKKKAALTDAEKLIIKTIADRLGWKEETAFAQLKEKLDSLNQNLRTKVEEAITTKVKAGFKYEYLRVSEREDLFSATLSEAGLEEFHLDLLRANVSPLIAHTLQQPVSNLLSDVKFLRKDIKKRERSSGFSLGFGSWVATNQNKVSMVQTTRTTEKGIQVGYQGQRSYEDGVGSSKRKWFVDFNAEMPHISNQPSTPLASEFDYSLYLQYEWTEKKFKPANVDSFLDLCRLWNVISEGQWPALKAQLERDLDSASAITYACTATYPHELFRVMVAAMGNTTAQLDQVFYQALGAALPYWAPYPIRMDIEKKALRYAPVWKEFIETESDLPQEIAAECLKEFDKVLAEKERNYAPNGVINFDSFAFAAKHNAQTRRRWKSFCTGVQELSKAIDRQAIQLHDPVINNAFQKMEDLWLFPHHVKAFGNYLVRIADQYPLRTQAVNTARVSYTKKDKEQVLIIGKT